MAYPRAAYKPLSHFESIPDRLYRSRVLSLLRSHNRGNLQLLDKTYQQQYSFGLGQKDSAYIKVEKSAFFHKLFRFGALGFRASYEEGDWVSDNLIDVMKWFIVNKKSLDIDESSPFIFQKIIDTLIERNQRYLLKSLPACQHASKDLPSQFFLNFLGESLNSTPGHFNFIEQIDLHKAQLDNHRMIMNDLSLHTSSSERILEVECAWGSFTLYAALNTDCHVTAQTSSKTQFDYIQKKIRALNLCERIELIFGDISKVKGQFDRIIHHNFSGLIDPIRYFDLIRCCNSLLRPKGLLLLQTTLSVAAKTNSSRFRYLSHGMDLCESYNEKQQYPSLQSLIDLAEQSGPLSLVDYHDNTNNHWLTLSSWYEAFAREKRYLKRIGFDEKLIRSWEYSLALLTASYQTKLVRGSKMIFSP